MRCDSRSMALFTLVALVVFSSGCANQPPRPQGPSLLQYTQAGDQAYNRGQWADATDQYRKAIQMDEKLAYLWFRVGNSEAKLSRYKEAANAYEQVIALEPENLKAHHNLASVYLLAAKENLVILETQLSRTGTAKDNQYLKTRMFYLNQALTYPLQDMAGFTNGVGHGTGTDQGISSTKK